MSLRAVDYYKDKIDPRCAEGTLIEALLQNALFAIAQALTHPGLQTGKRP